MTGVPVEHAPGDERVTDDIAPLLPCVWRFLTDSSSRALDPRPSFHANRPPNATRRRAHENYEDQLQIRLVLDSARNRSDAHSSSNDIIAA